MIYLIEPYNAYDPKPKKKHWMQIAEEEHVFQQMIAQQQALREAASNKNASLPQNAPVNAQAVNSPSMVAGGGGKAVFNYFGKDSALVAGFTFTTSSNAAPSTATFTNTTTYTGIGALTYKWLLGSGSITSTSQTPTPQSYTTGSVYTVKLEVTESTFQVMKTTTGTFTLT
jgi:PKD repeat protein